MPDWTDLSPADVNAILDWFAADGPEQKEPDERDAALATAADIARARALFEGTAPLASGGLACGACHGVADGAPIGAARSGPDLTGAYFKYRDRALTLYLKRPCTPRQPELGAARYLTPDEAFALKGYLRAVALAAPGRPNRTANPRITMTAATSCFGSGPSRPSLSSAAPVSSFAPS